MISLYYLRDGNKPILYTSIERMGMCFNGKTVKFFPWDTYNHLALELVTWSSTILKVSDILILAGKLSIKPLHKLSSDFFSQQLTRICYNSYKKIPMIVNVVTCCIM